MEKTIADLRAEAKELGINTFGMGKDAIFAAIAANGAPMPEEQPEIEPEEEYVYTPPEDEDEEFDLPEEPVQPAAPAAAPDPVMVAVIAAQKAAEEYMKQYAAAVPQQPVKPSTPEAEIAKKHNNDQQVIQQQEKVPYTINTMPIGGRKVYFSTVNGHRVSVKPGETKMIPRAHAENFERMFKQARKNATKQEKLASAAPKEV